MEKLAHPPFPFSKITVVEMVFEHLRNHIYNYKKLLKTISTTVILKKEMGGVATFRQKLYINYILIIILY